jgi:hypothetical protein
VWDDTHQFDVSLQSLNHMDRALRKICANFHSHKHVITYTTTAIIYGSHKYAITYTTTAMYRSHKCFHHFNMHFDSYSAIITQETNASHVVGNSHRPWEMTIGYIGCMPLRFGFRLTE